MKNKDFFSIYNLSDNNALISNNLGGKATNLVKLKQANISVPDGYVIGTSLHENFLQTKIIPKTVLNKILEIKNKLGGKIAIRSSANCEDGDLFSMAGVFISEYVYQDSEVENVITKIFQQSHSKNVEEFLKLHSISVKNVRMGLIIQKLIEPDLSGVIYTDVNNNQNLVQYVDGFGSKLVDGDIYGSAYLVNQKGYITQSIRFDQRPISEKIQTEINNEIQKIKSLFPNFAQDIEFAIKGDELYILQARTLTTNLGKIELSQSVTDSLEETKEYLKKHIEIEKKEMEIYTSIFSDSNYSELLPKPAPMDIGIYKYVSGGNDGIEGATQIGRKAMGYLVGPEATGIIHYIGGRTYFSIARNAAIYHIGFPESKKEYFSSLVNEYLHAIELEKTKAEYPQMGLYLQDPTINDLKQRYGKRANKYYQIYKKFVVTLNKQSESFINEFKNKELPSIERFTNEKSKVDISEYSLEQLSEEAIEILEHIRLVTYVNFVKSARLGFYYSQRLRELFSDEIYSKLNQGLDGSEVTNSNIRIAEATTEEEAIKIALEKIGHMSTGEMLEIRHQPLRDNPQKLQAYVRGIRQTGTYSQDFNKQKITRINTQKKLLEVIPIENRKNIEEIIISSQTYMALRETIKYLFTKEYLLIRDILEEIAEKLNLNNGDIYYLYPREIPIFVKDYKKMLHLINARKQFFVNAEKFDLPAVILEEDVDKLQLKNEISIDFDEVEGKFLAEGKVFTGIVINSDEFQHLEEVFPIINKYKKSGNKIILVAKQMNLSHDPLIVQADGLLIENAGIVAHGAQRARELGKGAIGGIKSSMLKTGTIIKFDPKKRKIKKVKK